MSAQHASVALVWPFLSFAEKAGNGDVSERVRAFLSLSEAEFADPRTRVPLEALLHLLDAALRENDERDIGLLAAEHLDGLHLGLLEHVARTRPTLREATEAAMRYVPLVGGGVQYEFEEDGNLATSRLVFDPAIEPHEAAVEFILAVGLLWARRVTGDGGLSPREIHFVHQRPASIARHEALFRCKLVFGAPVTKVVMSVSGLARPLGEGQPVLARLLEHHAEGELEALPAASNSTAQVRQVLSAQKDLRHITADQVARRLGVGTRTLARRLRDERTSYREVLDAVRSEIARRELANAERSIADIAERLGFASPQGFNRAFHRWTGASAANWRRRQRD